MGFLKRVRLVVPRLVYFIVFLPLPRVSLEGTCRSYTGGSQGVTSDLGLPRDLPFSPRIVAFPSLSLHLLVIAS